MLKKVYLQNTTMVGLSINDRRCGRHPTNGGVAIVNQ